MKLSYQPFTLQLKHTFTVASASRNTTPIVLTQIEHDGLIGYGEASMPPYLGESQDTVMRFLSKVNLSHYKDPLMLEDILKDIDDIEPGNTAAKASIDIALHDLAGKIIGKPWHKLWGLNKDEAPFTSFTIGIDSAEVVKERVKEADQFKIYKIKLGLDNDKEMVSAIREVTDAPLTIDANQGWKDKYHALNMIEWLYDKNVLFIEQPMPKERWDDMAWLTENSPLPTIADESCKRLVDVPKCLDVFSGINIKYMKCTGMREAYKMAVLAKALDMKIMLGCMTETSCGISAAAQLSPIVDWADLDGAELISNDIFQGAKIRSGKIILNDNPGIGASKIQDKV